MKHQELEEIEKSLNDDIEYALGHVSKDNYIDAHFQPNCVNGEYDDNSLELAYQYSMLESIKNDPAFLEKMRFVLNNYA